VTWWRDNGDTLELTGAFRDRTYLGLTLRRRVERRAAARAAAARAIASGSSAATTRVRFELTEPINPIDAYILPGNRLLVADYTGRR